MRVNHSTASVNTSTNQKSTVAKKLSFKAKMARYFMNLMPNSPVYQEEFFVQELFKHPNYTALSEENKKHYHQRIVGLNIKKAKTKPFDLFYPGYDLKKAFKGKKLLDSRENAL